MPALPLRVRPSVALTGGLIFGLAVLAGAPASAQPLRRRPGLETPDRGDAVQSDARAQRVLDVLGPEHLLREAWRVTGKHFYEPARLGAVGWDALLERYLLEVAPARTPREVRAVTNRMLGELGVSHLALISGGLWQRELAQEFLSRPTVRAGCELVLIDGKLFVNDLADGGPAEAAGLLEGDEVLTLDGVPALESSLLESAGHDPGLDGPPGFCLRVRAGVDVELVARRQADGPTFGATLRPAPHSLIDATRRSVRVVERDGSKLGVIHLWHFMHADVYRTLRDALRRGGALAEVDALVLDLRGRGGSAGVVQQILGLFSGRRAVWKRPLVALTDAGTRSAKEIFAFHWLRLGLGPIVGERTAGACIGCAFHELSDGSVLMLPVMDVRRLTRGEVLEGKGVAPTVAVADTPLPYRAGADPILEAGLREAAAQAVEAGVRAR